MITNPYRILGVPDGASEEECTKAYKRLAKKYHPDLNPGNKDAEKKMAEINAAYDQIKNGSGGTASYGGYSYSSKRQNASSSAPDYLSSAAQFIRSGQYQQAVNLLNNIQDRNAKWYYLSALANMSLGNRGIAENHIRSAYAKEPDNPTYQQAYQNIINGINPLHDNPFSSFFDFGNMDYGSDGSSPYEGDSSRRTTRSYTVNTGCLRRILRIVFAIIIIRFVLRLALSIGGGLFGFRTDNHRGSNPTSYSEEYSEDQNGGDPGQYFGESHTPANRR